MDIFDSANAQRIFEGISPEEKERIIRLRDLKNLEPELLIQHFKDHPEDLNPGVVLDSKLKDAHPFIGVLRFNPKQLQEYLDMGGEIPQYLDGEPTVFSVASRYFYQADKDEEIKKWTILVNSGMDIGAFSKRFEKNIIYLSGEKLPEKFIDDVLSTNPPMDYFVNGGSAFNEFFKRLLTDSPDKNLSEEGRNLVRKISKHVELNKKFVDINHSLPGIMLSNINENNIDMLYFLVEIGVDLNQKSLKGVSAFDWTNVGLLKQLEKYTDKSIGLVELKAKNILESGLSGRDIKAVIHCIETERDLPNEKIFGKPLMESELIKSYAGIQTAINAKEARKTLSELKDSFKRKPN